MNDNTTTNIVSNNDIDWDFILGDEIVFII